MPRPTTAMFDQLHRFQAAFDFVHDRPSLRKILQLYGIQWRHQGGGGHGGKMPPVGGSAPHLPPSQKKKLPKSAIFGKFLDFCPLRIAFCPLDAPHKKFWCRHWWHSLQNDQHQQELFTEHKIWCKEWRSFVWLVWYQNMPKARRHLVTPSIWTGCRFSCVNNSWCSKHRADSHTQS